MDLFSWLYLNAKLSFSPSPLDLGKHKILRNAQYPDWEEFYVGLEFLCYLLEEEYTAQKVDVFNSFSE